MACIGVFTCIAAERALKSLLSALESLQVTLFVVFLDHILTELLSYFFASCRIAYLSPSFDFIVLQERKIRGEGFLWFCWREEVLGSNPLTNRTKPPTGFAFLTESTIDMTIMDFSVLFLAFSYLVWCISQRYRKRLFPTVSMSQSGW